nr:MAG TPA: hypothetical protein [Caudoviricetes sp.]
MVWYNKSNNDTYSARECGHKQVQNEAIGACHRLRGMV